MKASKFLGRKKAKASFLAVKVPAGKAAPKPTAEDRLRATAPAYQRPNGADYCLDMLVLGLMLAGSCD